MRHFFYRSCLVAVLACGAVQAQETPIAGIEMGASEVSVISAIDAACSYVVRVEVADTRFPAASDTEVHLRCSELTLEDGRKGGDAIFTFADDSLVMIETRGMAANMHPNADTTFQVDGFDIYVPAMTIVNEPNDQAGIFNAFPLIPLVMFWDNPVWQSDDVSAPDGDFFLPPEVVFGAALADMSATLKDACALSLERPIDEVWLATEPAAQFQIDCYGYEMAGYPRKFEFVFGDETLQQMWLMFDTADIPRLREFLTSNYGEPIMVDEKYEVFDDWRLALRKDIPEIRMVSDEIAKIWAAENE